METAELKSLVKDLNAAATAGKPEDVVTILNRLKSSVRATEDLLRETKAGVAVGKLRSHASKDVSILAKDLVKKWRTEVDASKKTKGSPAGSGKPPNVATNLAKKSTDRAASSESPSTPAASLPPSTPTTSSHPTPQPQKTPVRSSNGASDAPRSTKTDQVKVPPLGDKVRDAGLIVFYDAIAWDSNAPSDLIMKRALQIETQLYKESGNSTAGDYRAKMRRLSFNLKAKNNPGLRRAVVEGNIPVERFCKMTNEELASEERRQADALINEKNLHNSLGAGEPEAETDAFKCGRCGQRKTRYRQAQTRCRRADDDICHMCQLRQ
jgi:transcription elongation factor S-II